MSKKKNRNKIRGQNASIVIFDEMPLAMTMLNGKPAPWSPFGVEPDPRTFSRNKRELCKDCGCNKIFCECEKVGEK
jgi:hypothetical protein